MIENILNGMIKKLRETFPDHPVYTDAVEQGVQMPCFFIAHVTGAREQIINNRYQDRHVFCVHYLPDNPDNSESKARVIERLYDGLEFISLPDGDIQGKDLHAEPVGEMIHFYATYAVQIMYIKNQVKPMDSIASHIGGQYG